MENYLWQKTLLDMYHTFDRVVMMMDNKFDRLVSNSLHSNNTNFIYDEMLEIMSRKNNCLTAKLIVDEALDRLCNKKSNILSYYYRNKMSFRSIAELEKINIRQVFRNYEKEIANFTYYLSKSGYSTPIIEEEFGKDNMFKATFNKLNNKLNNKGKMSMQLQISYSDEDNKKNQVTKFVNNNNVCLYGSIN